MRVSDDGAGGLRVFATRSGRGEGQQPGTHTAGALPANRHAARGHRHGSDQMPGA